MTGTLAAVHLVLGLVLLHPIPYIGGDNAAYYALARSLLELGEYRELWDPATPAHATYPPLFPAMLAGALLVGARGWAALKLVGVLCSVGGVVASHRWLRRETTPGVALAAGVALAVAPGVLEQAQLVLSDVPFAAFTALALLAFARLPQAGEPRAVRGEVLAALAVSLAYLTRAAGLPLFLAALLLLAYRRRWRGVGILAGVVGVPAFLWWLRGRSVGEGYAGAFWLADSYQPALGRAGAGEMARRVGENAATYAGEHLPTVLLGSPWAGAWLGAAVVLLALAGWARRLRKPGLAEAWAPLYVALLLLWPAAWSGERFLLPLLAPLLLWTGEAVRDGWARARAPRVPALAVAAALALAALPGLLAGTRGAATCRVAGYDCLQPMWRDLLGMGEAVRGRLPEGAVVLSRKPQLFWAISGYRGRLYPLSTEPDSFFRAAAAARADWVVIDMVPDLAPLYLHPVLLERRGDFCIVADASLPEAALARIDTAGPSPRPGSAANAYRSCPLVPQEGGAASESAPRGAGLGR